jgi:hypothetical protein
MVQAVFQAPDRGGMILHFIPVGAHEELADGRFQLNEHFLVIRIRGLGVFNLDLQPFDQLPQITVVHGKTPPLREKHSPSGFLYIITHLSFCAYAYDGNNSCKHTDLLFPGCPIFIIRFLKDWHASAHPMMLLLVFGIRHHDRQ